MIVGVEIKRGEVRGQDMEPRHRLPPMALVHLGDCGTHVRTPSGKVSDVGTVEYGERAIEISIVSQVRRTAKNSEVRKNPSIRTGLEGVQNVGRE